MVGQLPPAVTSPTGTEEFIVYVAGIPMTMTAEQAAGTGTIGSEYILQWAPWFNQTPASNELLALYVAVANYQYLADFAGSYSAAPIANPSASFVLNVDQQVGGTGGWTTIGTITVSTAGAVAFATTGGVAIDITAGDRLRVIGPSTADSTISGFSATLKGEPPTP